MERFLKQLLGYLPTDRQVYEFKPGVRTTIPTVKDPLTEQEWMQTFRVSIAHGKSIVYFG